MKKKDVSYSVRKPLGVRIGRQKYLLLMLLPGILWYVVFKYLPMLGLSLAFTDYGFRAKVSFIGLKNFRRLFSSAIFWNAFRNTLLISIMNIVFYFPVPLLVALMINELKSLRVKKGIQFLIYIPYFFSWVVVGSIFVNLLSPSAGPVNAIIKALGHDPIYFMASPKHFRGVIVLSYIWRQMGYGAVIYIAALTTVDPQLYEAAIVDGAGRWRRIINITVPGILPTVVTMFIMNIGKMVKVGYESILLLYEPSTYATADVISTYSFRMGIQNGDYGVATAAGLFEAVIALVLVVAANKVSKRLTENALW